MSMYYPEAFAVRLGAAGAAVYGLAIECAHRLAHSVTSAALPPAPSAELEHRFGTACQQYAQVLDEVEIRGQATHDALTSIVTNASDFVLSGADVRQQLLQWCADAMHARR